MSEIMIEGGTLHYEMYGQGPRVVLTSGGRSGMSELRPLAKQLHTNGMVSVRKWRRGEG
jgi:NAD(P)H-flavin reductase